MSGELDIPAAYARRGGKNWRCIYLEHADGTWSYVVAVFGEAPVLADLVVNGINAELESIGRFWLRGYRESLRANPAAQFERKPT